jgi:hypothetical protein
MRLIKVTGFSPQNILFSVVMNLRGNITLCIRHYVGAHAMAVGSVDIALCSGVTAEARDHFLPVRWFAVHPTLVIHPLNLNPFRSFVGPCPTL